MGVRHALFPMPALGAVQGCRLPDAILHGMRSCRPRSRAVQRLPATGFRVRLFSSLRLVVAPPAYEPGQNTSVIFESASWPLNSGSATAYGGALARGHGSRLLTLRSHLAHSSALSFVTSPSLWKVFTSLAVVSCPSRRQQPPCPAFTGFRQTGCDLSSRHGMPHRADAQ
jgi:hypothetical protein